MSTHLIPRVLSHCVSGEPSHNNDVPMAITVREFPSHSEAVRKLRSGIEYCRPYGAKSPLPFKQEFLFPDPRTKTYWRRNRAMARILSIRATRNWSNAGQRQPINWCHVQVRKFYRSSA